MENTRKTITPLPNFNRTPTKIVEPELLAFLISGLYIYHKLVVFDN
jgi:hypothetical protein